MEAQRIDNFFHHFQEERRIVYGLNNRQTRFLGDGSTLYGTYLGIEWGDRLRHVFTLNSTLFWVGRRNQLNLETPQLHLNYFGIAEEYLFYRRGRWDFSSYWHMGVGKAYFRDQINGVPGEKIDSHWVIPLELGLQTEYHLNDWLSGKVGAGWRQVFLEETHALDGYYFKVAVGVNVRYIWARFLEAYAQYPLR